MQKRRPYRELGDIELGPDLDEKVRVMTEAADRDIEEAHVGFHWGRQQLATVKLAAELLGVPYQMYIKQIIFKQAVADIRDADSVAHRVADGDDDDPHIVPVQGGPDEDDIPRQRLAESGSLAGGRDDPPAGSRPRR